MKRVVVLAATVCLIAGMYSISPYHSDESAEAVQLIQPEVNDILDTATLHGSVVDPARRKLYAEGTSRVLEIYVREGDYVKKGQALMRLEKIDELAAEQAAAASALGELKNTLELGDLSGAETMLEEMIYRSTAVANFKGREVYELYSPIDGMVMEISVQTEAEISRLLSCIEITKLDELLIEVSAGEDILGKLKENMDCTISIPAFSIQNLKGEISGILPYAKETGLFTGNTAAETTVQITPLENNDSLRPGYRASAKVTLSLHKNALLLPYEAVAQDEQGNEYVLTLENHKLVKAIVLTGAELVDQVEICSGITAKDLVVLYPKAEQEGAVITIASHGSDDIIQ